MTFPYVLWRTVLQGFFREAILWFNLNHQNVLKFKGIADEVPGLPGVCMVLQWAENGDLRKYLDQLVRNGLRGLIYVDKVDQWVCWLPSFVMTSPRPFAM